MDTFSLIRLARLLFTVLFVFCIPLSAQADFYYWKWGSTKWYSSSSEACKQNYPNNTNFAYSVEYPMVGGQLGAQCFWYGTTNGVQNTYAEQSGGDVSTGKCLGDQIPDYENLVCIDPPPPPECSENQELDTDTNTCVCITGPAGAFAVSGDVLTGCNNGCTIVLNSGSYSSTSNKTYGNWSQNGNTCAPSPEIPGVDSPDSQDGQDAGKCPTGQCPGTLNGQFMCVPCKGKESSDSSSSENTTETPSGASAPAGSASQSQSGSKSTECEGGVCTTKETVVVRNPDGSTTEKQKETTESISDYCAKNPKASICKTEEAGQWSGACSGGFQCKGDPVQCAQAREVAQLRCAFDVSPDDPLAVSGGLAMNDQLTPSGHPGAPGSGLTVDVMDKIEESPVFGSSGNCISDRTFSVIGMSLTLPFASMCPYFNMIGNVFLSCCYLVAGFIVFRR